MIARPQSIYLTNFAAVGVGVLRIRTGACRRNHGRFRRTESTIFILGNRKTKSETHKPFEEASSSSGTCRITVLASVSPCLEAEQSYFGEI